MRCPLLIGLTLAVLSPATLAQDPVERLSVHPRLRDIEWRSDDTLAPLVFLTQRPLPADKVAGFHGPWLQRLEQEFRERVAEPAGLRAGAPHTVVCLFASEVEWRRYADHEGVALYPPRYGTYDQRLGVTLACEGPRGSAAAARLRPPLRAFATALVASHYSGVGSSMPEAWIALGLPDYLSFQTGTSPDELAVPACDPTHLATLVEVLQRADLRAVYLPTVGELSAASAFGDLWPAMQARAEEARVDAPLEGYASRVFHELLPLWMHFLLDGEDGRHREAFARYLKSAMQGGGGPAALATAFSGASLEDVERAFLNWVYAQYRVAGLGNEYGARPIELLFDERAALSASGAVTASAAALDSTRLLPDPRDVSTAHAQALELAARGEYGQAIAQVEELWTRERAGAHGERLGRELERLKQFAMLRDAFLVESVAKGRRLPLVVEGKKRTFKLLGVSQGIVELDDRKKELPVVRVEDLDPHLLAKEMSKLGEAYRPAEVPSWMRLYAYILAGDSTWTKLLKDRSEAAEAVRADRESYDVLVPTGAAARDLERIAARTLPLNDSSAQTTEDDLRALLKTHGELLIVRERLVHLRQLARSAEEVLFEMRGLRALFSGDCKELGDGRVRLLYEFDHTAELDDFIEHADYLPDFRGTLPALLKPAGEAETTLEEGAWTVLGATSYRHILPFVAPVTVKWKIKYGYVTPGGTPDIHDFLAVCDNGAESYAALTGMGSLVVVDKPGYHRFEHVGSDKPFTAHKVFELELEHDGRVVTSRVNGEPVREVPCGPRTAGRALLFFHTDVPASIEELVIEGRVDPLERKALRDTWVESRLSEIGFGD
jgi:hypothetical protein